jgi:hypothetical protein
MQQKVQVPGKVSTPRKCLGASIDAAARGNSDYAKNGVQTYDVIERDDPEERVDPAGRNEIVEGVQVAETTMRSGKCGRGRAAKTITTMASSCQAADKRTVMS